MARSQANAGGQLGVNGYLYKGGQFLPSTQAEPGRWKVNGKWVKTGRVLIGPGEFAVQPTPFSVPLFRIASPGYFTVLTGCGKLAVNPGAKGDGVLDYAGKPITAETEIRPGVAGVLGKESISLGKIIEAWNDGLRWFDVQPDAETKTT